MLYAHLDVQPTGPEQEWTRPPFRPSERGGRLYGRGAAEDEAGLLMHLAVLRAFGARPPVGVVLFLEGEEEVGSPTLTALLAADRDLLAADVIVIADAANAAVDVPSFTTSLRGWVELTVDVRLLERPASPRPRSGQRRVRPHLPRRHGARHRSRRPAVALARDR